ncbi:MAG TPA: DUF3226 domain-containing protein, partial [Thermoanaerobaculia bacterium]|nr:DUF3226 domain-containing protein [Thermoanaerobaculia bacterium]
DGGGYPRILDEGLPVALKTSAEALAIVLDADLDLAARWQAVSDRLQNHGYAVPATPSGDGLVLTDRHPVVGVWLMPDNILPGMLEDFAANLVGDDPLWPRATDAVRSIPDELRRFPRGAARKAEIHTWLAWQEEPGTPLGLAVTKRYFQTDTELCRRFTNWLRRLIELSEDSS